MLLATLDVINVLPENPNPKIAKRLIEIIAETDDTDILDKSVLALGVAGDHTQPIVDTLFSLMSKSDTEEGTKIHVALVMGRQADLFPDKPKEALSRCLSSATTQSLKTACQLGNQELQTRRKTAPASTEKKS